MRAYDPASPLISLHIPKCAGQTFRVVLKGFFNERLYYHYFQQFNQPPPLRELGPGTCVHGHFNRVRGFGVRDCYPGVRQFITVLRDPLQAAVSNYFFWKQTGRANQLASGRLIAGSAHDYPDITAFFRMRPKSNMLDFMPLPLTTANFREYLEQSFVWIGLTEFLSEDAAELAVLLDQPAPATPRLNVSFRDESLPPDVEARFRDENRLEFEIYDWARQMRNGRNPRPAAETGGGPRAINPTGVT